MPREQPHTWDQAHTRQLRQEQETRGEKTSPEPHRVPWSLVWDHSRCGAAAVEFVGLCRTNGIIHTSSLALGTAWISWGASAAL